MGEENDEGQVVEEITEQDPTEVAAKALHDGGDEVGALKLQLEHEKRARLRAEAKVRERDLESYKAEIIGEGKEFEYADPSLVTGSSKQAIRASAEKLHRSVAAVIEKRGLKPSGAAPPPGTPPAEKSLAEKKADWGPPPPASKEASSESPKPWADIQRGAADGSMSREQVMDEVFGKSGVPRISRPSIRGAAIRVREEAAAEPAKT